MRSEEEANRVVEQYANLVRRICFLHLKNHADVEDIFQTVFLKYVLYSGTFESDAHEKAWFIRVTINACKDILKSFFRQKNVPLDLIAEAAVAEQGDRQLLTAVLSLQKKYKDVIYLHYFEGYSAAEIARILGENENTIYSRMSRARKLLKEQLGGEELE
jgi:RNA polymerase sigma factor (sigma-70 family)